MKLLSLVIFSFAMIWSTAAVAAMTIQAVPRTDIDRIIEAPLQITLSGEIDEGAPARLRSLLSKNKGLRISVHLNSPGGNLAAGLALGRILRKEEATVYVGTTQKNTYVSGPGICFSACSLAFLGGSYRFMSKGSVYGVHRGSTQDQSFNNLDTGQIVAAATAAYIREMGVDLELLDLSVKAGADGMYVLSNAELERLQVVNNGRKSPVWTIEVADGGTYLRGIQETVFGTGKMSIFCTGKEVGLMSSYTAGDKAELVLKGGWAHSLFIDDDMVPLPDPDSLDERNGMLHAVFPIKPQTLRQMIKAKAVGHAMQLDRSAPTYLGYRVDIDEGSRKRYATYLGNCLR